MAACFQRGAKLYYLPCHILSLSAPNEFRNYKKKFKAMIASNKQTNKQTSTMNGSFYLFYSKKSHNRVFSMVIQVFSTMISTDLLAVSPRLPGFVI